MAIRLNEIFDKGLAEALADYSDQHGGTFNRAALPKDFPVSPEDGKAPIKRMMHREIVWRIRNGIPVEEE